MKTFKEYILETQKSDNVYVVYFGDGTMYNFYDTKNEAQEVQNKLNNECADNKCIIKTEPLSNFES